VRGPKSLGEPRRTIDYDQVAPQYDQRYALHDYSGIRATILRAIGGQTRPRVLEVGCGSGQWLRLLASEGCEVAGLDRSAEMLRQASAEVDGDLRVGVADALPWVEAGFDLVLYVNAFHHFEAPEVALREALRVLRPGGAFLSVGLDPHERPGRWYVYDFFPGTLELDLARFPSRARRSGWLATAGFEGVSVRVAEQLQSSRSLEDATHDGILQRSFTSQLTALAPEEYLAGLERIRSAAEADAAFRLEVDLTLYATEAYKPDRRGAPCAGDARSDNFAQP
jgi:ubiquinone/menaquinone biosynthesis C-methylase UbiE